MFRDASGRIPQQNDPYANAFTILGTIMGQKAKERGEAKSSEALTSLYAPIETNMTDTNFQDLTPQGSAIKQQTAQGLLPTGFNQQVPTSNDVGQGLLGQPMQQSMSRDMQAPQTVQQPTNFNISNPLDKYSIANNPVSITSKTKDWNGIQKDIQSQGYKRIQELSKTMSADEFRKTLPLARQYIQDHITQAKADYDKQAENDAWTKFDSAPDYKTKMMTGIKAGLNPALLKMALDTGVEIKTADLGDKIVSYGVDTHNNKLIDLTTGQALDPAMLTKGISAAQQEQFNIQREGQQIQREGQRARSSGGGGYNRGGLTPAQQRSADAKLINAKAIMSAYNDSGKPFINSMGQEDFKPYTTAEQIKFNQAAEYIKANDSNYGQNNQSNDQFSNDEDPRIAQARAAGYSEEEIQQFINGSSQPEPQQIAQPQYQQTNSDIGVDQRFVTGGFSVR